MRTSLLGLGLTAILASSCSLISAEVETDVKVKGTADGDDTSTRSCLIKNLNDIDDYKNNKDKLKRAEITGFLVRFTDTGDENMATRVHGRVNMRAAPPGTPSSDADGYDCDNPPFQNNEPWIQGAASWTPIYLPNPDDPACADNADNCRINEVRINPDAATLDAINQLLENVEVLDFQLEGFSDQAPLQFDWEVTAFLYLQGSA